MGLVNNSLRTHNVRKEYLQAIGAAASLVVFSLVFGPTPSFSVTPANKPEVRMAYFPNLTHAPALIGVANHTFEASLPKYAFSTKVVNAGPEAMEALLAGAIDVAYVGPSPALNTYVKTHGSAIRIIAGACEGGAALMCRKDLNIKSVADLSGHRVAVPEFGGTQDVSLRHFMHEANLTPREQGGTVEILPIKNPEILALFKSGQIDAAWVPEPWASRLAIQAGAKTVAEETDLWPTHRFSTTVMVVASKFLDAHPDAVATLVKDNQSVVSWIGSHETEAKALANAQIGKLTGKPLGDKVVNAAWSHLQFSSVQDRDSLVAFASAARDAGYIKPSAQVDDKIWLPSLGNSTREVVASASK